MRIAVNVKETNNVWSESWEVSGSLWMAGMKSVEIRTCCKAKYLIAQLMYK